MLNHVCVMQTSAEHRATHESAALLSKSIYDLLLGVNSHSMSQPKNQPYHAETQAYKLQQPEFWRP